MRIRQTADGLTAMAIAGTHVVLLGWDMSAENIRARSVLGFAIRRIRQRDDERIWLPGIARQPTA